jgi:nitroreductase
MSMKETVEMERSPLPIHPLLGRRFSPRAFADKPVTDEELELMLEAARWAPSSRNEQPWRFVVARRGEEGHADMLASLLESNRRWADKAPVLVLCLVRRDFERLAMPNLHAWHDMGLAIASLTFQATELGIGLHQLAGFQPDLARSSFGIPETYDLVSVLALGHTGSPDLLPPDLRDRELAKTTRHPLDEIVHHGRFRG